MLAAIFDTVTAGGEGVSRLEPCQDWRPYVVAAIPKAVEVFPAANRAEDGTHPRVMSRARRPMRRRTTPREGGLKPRGTPLRAHFSTK